MYRSGRINRPTYFLGLAIMVAAYAVMMTFMAKPPGIGEFLALMLAIPRLHDIGKSGWWAGGVIVAELVVVGVGFALAIHLHRDDIILAMGGLFVLAALGLMVWLGCLRGDPGANGYGEAPPPGLSLKTYGKPKTPAAAGERLG